jgi:hypothetical protein
VTNEFTAEILIADKFFDIKEFKKSPLKSYIHYEYRPMVQLFKTASIYYVKRNKISVQNSPLGFGDYHEYKYFSVSKGDSYMRHYD